MTQFSWTGTWLGRSPDGLTHQRARDIVRPTGGIVRGKFPSRKTGRMVQYEGLLELDAIYLFEASPLIRSYTEQPETARYPEDSRVRRYTPDFELTLVDGSSVLIEVKPKRNADTPEIRRKLTSVADFYGRQSRAFEVLTDEQIRIAPRLASLRWIYHQAPRVHPSALKGAIALRRLESEFPMAICVAAECLGPYGLDPYSLLMAGVLVCDLSVPVTLEASIKLNFENNHAWFRVSDRFGF